MIEDYFKIGFNNIKKKKLRSSLTVLGIIISIATIFVLISLSIGLNGAINEQFRQLGSDKFFVQPKGQAGGAGAGAAVRLTTEDVKVIKKIPGVNDATYINIGNAEIKYKDKSRFYMVMGMPTEGNSMKLIFEAINLEAEDGRFIKDGESKKVILGNNYKTKELLGKQLKINDKISLNGVEFEVTGILKPVGNAQDDQQVYIAMEDFKGLFNSGDRADIIWAQIKPGEDIIKIADNTKRKLMNFRNVDEKNVDFTISTPEELLKSFATILNIVTAFLLGVAGISLLVGAIGIANTMYTSVLERTKEIGTMKAIGAKNSDILWIFVIESGLLGFVGGVIGIFFGMGIGKIVELIAQVGLGTNLLKVVFPWYLILGCLLFAFGIGAFSGFFPARQASKIKPADTLRYE